MFGYYCVVSPFPLSHKWSTKQQSKISTYFHFPSATTPQKKQLFPGSQLDDIYFIFSGFSFPNIYIDTYMYIILIPPLFSENWVKHNTNQENNHSFFKLRIVWSFVGEGFLWDMRSDLTLGYREASEAYQSVMLKWKVHKNAYQAFQLLVLAQALYQT